MHASFHSSPLSVYSSSAVIYRPPVALTCQLGMLRSAGGNDAAVRQSTKPQATRRMPRRDGPIQALVQ
jgi:hypothetical protein